MPAPVRALLACVALLAGVSAVVTPAFGARAVVPVTEAAATTVPRFDHVVVVVEENHSLQEIIGNPAAPYINSLAADGANFTQFFAEQHPSQPNYLALFSGSTQGVTTDACPNSFDGPNLGSELIAAGLGFTGYSEDLPSVGFTGCSSGEYVRKHNPWVNFTNVPAGANQPFSAFPSDYSSLPAVSFVVPNLQNDMHDGTIAQADTWLRDNLGGYADWAATHNSILVTTWDEGSGLSVPTIIDGAHVTPGSYGETLNHYNLLRTIEDAYGLPPVGASANADPILDIWGAAGGGGGGGGSGNIAFVAAADSGGGSTRDQDVTLPAGAQPGDTALLFLNAWSNASWTEPSGVDGWTLLGSEVSGGLTSTVWEKTVAAGDPGSTVTFSSDTHRHASVVVGVYSGVDGAAPVGAIAQSGDLGGTDHVTPDVTASAGQWVVSMWTDRALGPVAWTAPDSVVTRDSSADVGLITDQTLLADSGGPVPAGDYGGLTATTDLSTYCAAMWTIALNPSG